MKVYDNSFESYNSPMVGNIIIIIIIMVSIRLKKLAKFS
jgi:Trk-type K+ transport system membrane component